ncbi:MAG: D-alanyl-D-alanine carboxypeptidase family protein [Alphaproteobacteria bacterium]
MTRFLLFCLIFMAPMVAAAQDGGFSTPAPHVVIMDFDTGLVLYEKDARRAVAPASMTKIMTAELVFDRIRDGSLSLDTEFTVSEEAWRRGGGASGSSTMFLDLNSKVRVEDLLRGVIIQSGNDACIVLAEGIAGSETAFADMMTKHAREIGLTSATFRNATGWPHPEHNISAYDLALLGSRTIAEYPEFYSLYAERGFTWNGIAQSNRNPLLGRFTGADGLKTGHTESSGYGLVASAKRGDIRRVLVVNGLDSKAARRNEGIRLMQAAFDQFSVETLFAAESKIAPVKVFMGREPTVEAVSDASVQIGVYRGHKKDIKVEMRSLSAVAAPITKGDHIADIVVTVPGQEEQVFPLTAANDVKRQSALGRVVTALKAKIQG